MAADDIFGALTPEVLEQIAAYLKWDPLVATAPARLLSQSSGEVRKHWLNFHRAELQDYISWVGTPIFSYAMGKKKDYRDILCDLANLLGVVADPHMSSAQLESAIVQKTWADTLNKLTPEKRATLVTQVEQEAAKYGKSLKSNAAGFAGLAAAQMSGFGVYMLGSTLLGAINSALGLGLGFGAFTGLSSAISLVIGPIGWAALGLYSIRKLGAPNYKKLLPAVILIAASRAGSAQSWEAKPKPEPPGVMNVAAQEATKRIGVDTPLPHSEVVIPPEWKFAARKATGGVSRPVEKLKSIPRRFYSKSEKTIFGLQPENRILCAITSELEPNTHFLDLPEDQKEIIRQLVEERAEEERLKSQLKASLADQSRKEQRRMRKRAEADARRLKKDRYQRSTTAVDYARLLHGLEFDEDALQRLSVLQGNAVAALETALSLMSHGHIIYRDKVERTEPPVYEQKSGYDYRIYFYPSGLKIRIRLIGDKGTQQIDCDAIRRDPIGKLFAH